jgi:integrase
LLEIDGVHPHRLRRTYATQFVAQLAGDPRAIVSLQKHLGWQSLETAASYVDSVNKSDLDNLGGRMIDDLMSDR